MDSRLNCTLTAVTTRFEALGSAVNLLSDVLRSTLMLLIEVPRPALTLLFEVLRSPALTDEVVVLLTSDSNERLTAELRMFIPPSLLAVSATLISRCGGGCHVMASFW